MANLNKLKSFRCDEKTICLVNDLKKTMHLPTSSAVFVKALTLLNIAIENQNNGGSILLKNGDSEKEVILN